MKRTLSKTFRAVGWLVQTSFWLVAAGIGSEAIASPDRATVVLFGDSITVGINLNSRGKINGAAGGATADSAGQQGVPTLYTQSILDQSRRRAVVVNWGHGGSNTEQGAARISSNLASTNSQYPSDQRIFLMMYGTNDFDYGMSDSETGFFTGLMIDRARNDHGYTPFVATLTPRSDRDVRPTNSVIRSVASSKGAQIVDHFNRFFDPNNTSSYQSLMDFEPLNSGNGYLHPNDEGYRVIADFWFSEVLEGLIEASPPALASVIQLLLLDEEEAPEP